jgi:hypothetical protein
MDSLHTSKAVPANTVSTALPRITPRCWGVLLCIVLIALGSRIYSAQNVGWNWDHTGSFNLVNFDEASSCMQYLSAKGMERHVGMVTVTAAKAFTTPPPAKLYQQPDGWHLEDSLLTSAQRQENQALGSAIRAYCHSAEHLLVARTYSAVLGGLTVLLLGLLGMLLIPESPRIGLTAAALLAVSGFHSSQSHMATLDAPSVFFVYAMITWAVYCLRSGIRGAWIALPLLLYLAITAKEWPFALFSLAAFLPAAVWNYLYHGFTTGRFVLALLSAVLFLSGISNTDPVMIPYFLLAGLVYCLAVPWRAIHRPMLVLWLLLPLAFLLLFDSGHLDGIFARHLTGPQLFHHHGTGWSAIGWHKVLRNFLNLPLSVLMGIGALAFCALVPGIRAMLARKHDSRVWLVLLSVLVFAIFLGSLMTTPYYRHYLMLIPACALLAAMGFWSLKLSKYRWSLVLFLAWPALLGLDMVSDYHLDPRKQMRDWYYQAQPERVFMSYFVNPPAIYAHAHQLFTPEYAQGDAGTLRQAQYLILSENWYDTAFRNEMNGPMVGDLAKLLGTKPEYARFYRQAVADQHPYLSLEQKFPVVNYMPELVLHKWLYGTFQMFVGDVLIFRVKS